MRALTAAVVLLLGGSAPALAASEDTSPVVRPASGLRSTVFRLSFTLRHDAGHAGVLDTSYRVALVRPRGTRAACAAGAVPRIDSGRAGQRRRVLLPAPRHGWCPGRYRVSILLTRGPYCPPTHDQPCPEFATREQPAGGTSFRVRPG